MLQITLKELESHINIELNTLKSLVKYKDEDVIYAKAFAIELQRLYEAIRFLMYLDFISYDEWTNYKEMLKEFGDV